MKATETNFNYLSGQSGNVQGIGCEAHAERDTILHVEIRGHQRLELLHVLLSAELVTSAASRHAVIVDGFNGLIRAGPLIFCEAQIIVGAEIDRWKLFSTESVYESI